MRKILVFTILALCILGMSVEQKYMIEICKAYGMNEERARHFTAQIIEEATLSNFDPMIIFKLAIAETGLKNVIGDNGKAVGYFQLHQETVWFVKQKYNLKNVPKHHTDLIYNIDLQIKIAVLYFRYLLDRYGSIDAALKAWNGSEKYIAYYNQVAEYIDRVYLARYASR